MSAARLRLAPAASTTSLHSPAPSKTESILLNFPRRRAARTKHSFSARSSTSARSPAPSSGWIAGPGHGLQWSSRLGATPSSARRLSGASLNRPRAYERAGRRKPARFCFRHTAIALRRGRHIAADSGAAGAPPHALHYLPGSSPLAAFSHARTDSWSGWTSTFFSDGDGFFSGAAARASGSATSITRT
jgi:hypothetical protein